MTVSDGLGIEGVVAENHALDEGLGRDLVNAPGVAHGCLEDAFCRLLGDEFGVGFGSFEVKPDVVPCVFKTEGPEQPGEHDACSEGVEMGTLAINQLV